MKKLLVVGIALIGITGCASAGAVVSVDQPEIMDNEVESVAIEIEEVEAVENVEMLIVDDETGSTSIDHDALETLLVPDDGVLSDEEIAGLLFMREEEKLAHDVYITLYGMWDINIFQNIANSEQTHTDAIKTLLDQYGLDDPIGTNPVGVFENEDLQALYDQLIVTGSESLGSALEVGAAIEEIDILDLEKYLVQTDNVNITLVYENLLKGSRNHLRAFASNIERQTDQVYTPQYLSQVAYDDIINSDTERGGRGRGNDN